MNQANTNDDTPDSVKSDYYREKMVEWRNMAKEYEYELVILKQALKRQDEMLDLVKRQRQEFVQALMERTWLK